MGESNDEWGQQHTDAARARRDRWLALPSLHDAESKILDQFLDERGLTREDLARIGARWNGVRQELCFFYADGLKWRSVDTGARRTEEGIEFLHLKVVKAQSGDGTRAIVAEGETDAAAIAKHAPTYDVLVLPAGALYFPDSGWKMLNQYELVLVALDADKAGDTGAQAILDRCAHARRLRPPEGSDWGSALLTDPWGDTDPAELTRARRLWYTLGEVLDANLGEYEDNHWFEHGILPRRGVMIFHAAMKSLKSVVQNELAVSLATGRPFADHFKFLGAEPAKVLMFQMEIPPFDYQSRLIGTMLQTPEEYHELLKENFRVYKIADGEMPRLKGTDPAFLSLIRSVADDAEADVLVFDPLQRMTHGSNMDKSDEMNPILDAFAELASEGRAIVFSHHNNKAGRNVADPYAMTGTQRFGADVDTVCSLYRPHEAVEDDNPDGIKERNFSWTLRNGFAPSRSVRTEPHPDNPHLMVVRFGDPITAGGDVEPELF